MRRCYFYFHMEKQEMGVLTREVEGEGRLSGPRVSGICLLSFSKSMLNKTQSAIIYFHVYKNISQSSSCAYKNIRMVEYVRELICGVVWCAGYAMLYSMTEEWKNINGR